MKTTSLPSMKSKPTHHLFCKASRDYITSGTYADCAAYALAYGLRFAVIEAA